jgi:proline iminopeptidase
MKFAILVFLPALALGQSAPTGHVQTPDVDIAYWVLGTQKAATPVIAVNGGPGLSHIYMVQNDVWDRLAKGRRIVLYDQRGTGASKLLNPNAPEGMDAQVADIDAIRAHLGFETADFAGDSYGGLLVMAYTAAHPEHVHKIILSDSAAPVRKDMVHLFSEVFPDKMEEQKRLDDSKAPVTTEPEHSLRDHFRLIFYSEEKQNEYLAKAKDLGSSPVGAAVNKANANLDLTPALPKFHCPTLVITGRYDMNVAPLTAWKIYKAIPGAKFIAFEKSGHLPSYEEPDKYVKVVNDFLTAK